MRGLTVVASEALEYFLDNFWLVTFLGFVAFWIGLEVSGYGLLAQNLSRKYQKKLSYDIVRVRELQQQLAMLRSVRAQKAMPSNEVDSNNNNQSKEIGVGSKLVEIVQPRGLHLDILTNAVETTKFRGPPQQNIFPIGEHDDLIAQGPTTLLYESTKDAWTWGRHETPLAPVLGGVEGVACKIIACFGTDLKEIDGCLKPHVMGFDAGVVKPSLHSVVSILFGKKPE